MFRPERKRTRESLMPNRLCGRVLASASPSKHGSAFEDSRFLAVGSVANAMPSTALEEHVAHDADIADDDQTRQQFGRRGHRYLKTNLPWFIASVACFGLPRRSLSTS